MDNGMRIIFTYCLIIDKCLILIKDTFFIILNFAHYCPLWLKKHYCPALIFPGFPTPGKPGSGNIANPVSNRYSV